MNHTLSGGLPENIIITAGYDREEVVASVKMDMTLRELTVLESALRRYYTEITDGDGKAVNCEQLDAAATYHLLLRVEMWNEAIKSGSEKSE